MKRTEEKVIQVISTRGLTFISIDEEFDVYREGENYYEVYTHVGLTKRVPKHQCKILTHIETLEFEIADPKNLPKSLVPSGVDVSKHTVTIKAVKDILEDYIIEC